MCIESADVFMDRSTPLLKLHGSMNWRATLGSRRPYTIDAIVHDEPWRPMPVRPRPYPTPNRTTIEAHLEPEPFIVPPVLLKSVLIEQPILRLVWGFAAETLRYATDVTFVGYSMPLTDIASTFLFRESLGHLSAERVTVIDIDLGLEPKTRLMNDYRAVFPQIGEGQFRFIGAEEWARRVVGNG